MRYRLEALTLFAASDILIDKGVHKWPPIVTFDQFKSEVPSRVSGRNGVVALLQDLAADFDVVGYIELSSVVHQSICFFPFCCSISKFMRFSLLHLFESRDDFGFFFTALSDPFFN